MLHFTMETQAICVDEESPGAEIKCHGGDLGSQVPEIPAQQAAFEPVPTPSSCNRFKGTSGLVWSSHLFSGMARPVLPASSGCCGSQNTMFAGKRAPNMVPQAQPSSEKPHALRQGQMAMRLDSILSLNPSFDLCHLSDWDKGKRHRWQDSKGNFKPVKPNGHTAWSYACQETNSPESGLALSQRLCL